MAKHINNMDDLAIALQPVMKKMVDNMANLKVGLFGTLDINKTRKKIKNSLAKLSSEKENYQS